MTPLPRRLLAAALLAATTAGCGQATSTSTPSNLSSPGPKPSVAGAVARATSNTEKAGSARFTMHMTMPSPQGEFSMRGAGRIAFGLPARGDMTLSMRPPGVPMEVRVDERIIGTTVYMRSPLMTQNIPGAKPWMKLDVAAAAKSQGLDLPSFLKSTTSDPTQLLAYMKGVTRGARVMGRQRIDGVSTTHYRANIDLYKVAARLPRASRHEFLAMMDAEEHPTEPIEVWIDGHGLLRQERLSYAMPSVGGSVSMLMKLSDFGVPVHVKAPPPSQTSDLAKLIAQTA